MRETKVQSLVREDSPEKEIAILSSILAWRIPWTEELCRLQSMEPQGISRDLATDQQQTVNGELTSFKELIEFWAGLTLSSSYTEILDLPFLASPHWSQLCPLRSLLSGEAQL